MLEKIGIFFENFLKAYGTSFLMMVFAGFIVAFLVEISVKKAFAYLEAKYEGKDRLLALLSAVKMAVIFIVTIVMCLVSTKLILKAELPLPGNVALAPFWFAIIYGAQYIFSMYGIKAILERKGLKIEKKPKVKKEKPKKVNPVEGMTKIARNVYKNAEGKFFNKKGEQI